MKSFCHIYAQWDQVNDRISEEASHLLGLGLTCDTTFGFSRAGQNRTILKRITEAGGLCAPNIYPANYAPECRDANWWKYPQSQCEEFLGKAAERFAALDLGPLQAVNTYTPGNTFVAACRRVGIGYILGFCAPTVIEDGGWEIAHYGSPLSPYFASDEDFRKPEAGTRADAVLMSSMELRNPMVCLNHWSEGPWCPLNALAADRWLEPSRDPLPFQQIAEDWLHQAELSGRPLFFHINLQYFFSGRCYEHNRRALEWLAAQRDKGRLEIGGLQAWAARLRAQGGFERQTSYWRGEMMGFHVGHRPGCFPDVIVDEHLGAQTIWQHPEPLPQRRYDYSSEWSYPAFQPDGSAPASITRPQDEVKIESAESGNTSRILTITQQGGGSAPVMIWEPFSGWQPPFQAEIASGEGETRIVPHPSGTGGALLVETPGPKLVIRVAGRPGGEAPTSRRWGNLVVGQTFHRGGIPYTVLAAQTPEPFAVEARIRRSSPEPVEWERLCGLDHRREIVAGDRITLSFDGTRLACWHRFWGLQAGEIDLIGVEAIEAGLRHATAADAARIDSAILPEGPGFQLFGNIRNPDRWDRRLARSAGEKEIHAIGRWFASKRPGAGKTVIEVHPGAFLPRGSITKVLGHEFDSITCAEDYSFEEICVDYPQGWDWGVSAWVQWRHLRVSLSGLKRGAGAYVLHLHAFDPERRDISQRVHFFNPLASSPAPRVTGFPVHQPSEICAVADWVLPAGLEGRWSDEALCSIEIPEMCLDWPAIGVRIMPVEKTKLYDWVAERGAPGLFSHLWVTCLP